MKKIIVCIVVLLLLFILFILLPLGSKNKIDNTSYHSSQSFDDRIRFLIIHYTSENFKNSIKLLTKKAVSAHYLIPDITDTSYIDAGFKNMRIFNLVDENKRAWHAGISSWGGRHHLNDTSIGIEIVNQAEELNGIAYFPPFTQEQMNALIYLASDILYRYPDITPTRILGHSDVAIGRKNDPGPAFSWKTLYDAGIGAWYEEDLKNDYVKKFTSSGLPVQEDILKKLEGYGYDIQSASTEEDICDVIRAFQLHFRSSNYDGKIDIETVAILYALVDKYFPEE